MKKAPSRPLRWAQAAVIAVDALTELQDIQQEFQDWRDNMPEGLESSPLGEKLDAITEIDIESALDTANEADGADPPLGFGRD